PAVHMAWQCLCDSLAHTAKQFLRMFTWLPKPPGVEEIQLHIPTIAPVAEEGTRPFWSVMIPTYNCGDYLRRTLQSVLAQDPGPDQMQIEVVDGSSTKHNPE